MSHFAANVKPSETNCSSSVVDGNYFATQSWSSYKDFVPNKDLLA